jgi:hypothetical protein
MPNMLPRVAKGKEKGQTMTTELMEVFSLEEGDQIIHHGQMFLVTSIEMAQQDYGMDIHCVDEEGYRRVIHAAGPMDKVKIIVEDA